MPPPSFQIPRQQSKQVAPYFGDAWNPAALMQDVLDLPKNSERSKDYGFLKPPSEGSCDVTHCYQGWKGVLKVYRVKGRAKKDQNIQRLQFLKMVQGIECGSRSLYIELPVEYWAQDKSMCIVYPELPVPRKSLKEVITSVAGEGGEETVVLLVLEHISNALATLHRAGVLHQNVTPDTIIQREFVSGNTYVLGGFEKVQRIDGRRLQFETWQNPTYVPPDYSNNFSLAQGWDTFALGLSLIQLACGIGEDEALLEVQNNCISPMPKVSLPVQTLLKRMVSQDPRDRPSLPSLARSIDNGIFNSELVDL